MSSEQRTARETLEQAFRAGFAACQDNTDKYGEYNGDSIKEEFAAFAASLRAAPAPIMGEAADALSQREASREAQGWQDISTAPRDATWVLVWSPHWRDGGLPTQVPSMAYWSHLSNCWADYDGKVYKPTVWMPLPSPPEIPS
jgi:hypothetical protein